MGLGDHIRKYSARPASPTAFRLNLVGRLAGFAIVDSVDQICVSTGPQKDRRKLKWWTINEG